MAERAAAGGEYSTSAAHSWIGEVLLRLLGAALQILATWAVVRALTPEEAGGFFLGFVIAFGLSTLLPGQYEIHMAQHIIRRRAPTTATPRSVPLLQPPP